MLHILWNTGKKETFLRPCNEKYGETIWSEDLKGIKIKAVKRRKKCGDSRSLISHTAKIILTIVNKRCLESWINIIGINNIYS